MNTSEVLEDIDIMGIEEEKQGMLKDMRDCGGLDPGEPVNKVVVDECSFKVLVEECGFKDKVWTLLCDVFFNLKFEFLVAWLVLMLHTTMRLRFVNICKTAFNLESLLRLSDYRFALSKAFSLSSQTFSSYRNISRSK